MTFSKKDIKKIINEEITIVLADLQEKSIKEEVKCYIGCARGAQLWFHAAHHVIKGPAFAGDHAILLSNIYTSLQEDFDSIVEKFVGVFKCDDFACPASHVEKSMELFETYGVPVGRDPQSIMCTGYEIILHLIDKIEKLFIELESSDSMSLGIDDLLSGLASKYETHAYLLQKRLE